MPRITVKSEGAIVTKEHSASEIAERLALFEDAYDEIIAKRETIPLELARLKEEGKEKTVRYRELFGEKLMLGYVVSLFARHGIEYE